MKVQNFMKHNIKNLLNFVANEIVEYGTENFSIILHCGTFIFVLLEKVSSQPYDKVLPLPPPRPSHTPHPQSFSHAETQRQATQHGCLTRLLVKNCAARKIIFRAGLTLAAKAGQKSYLFAR